MTKVTAKVEEEDEDMDLTTKQTQQQQNDDGRITSGGTTANLITSDPTHGDGEEAHVEPSEVHWRRSNKGTGGMESSVVLFKPRIHLFACTHPSVSNSLDCNDWLAYKHQSTALCSTTAL